MIPFDELVHALERYKRKQAGENVPDEAPRSWSGGTGRAAPSERSAEISLDEVESE